MIENDVCFVTDRANINQPIDCLMAAADSKNSCRSRLTLEPLSKAINIPIDSRFSARDPKDIVDELKARHHGHNILISWHHKLTPDFLRMLGVNANAIFPKGVWPGSIYNWMIQLSYDSNGDLFQAHLSSL